jgi:hypothetical protein
MIVIINNIMKFKMFTLKVSGNNVKESMMHILEDNKIIICKLNKIKNVN